MLRISTQIALTAMAAVLAFGQATQPSAGPSSTDQSTAASGNKGEKKYQGVLMDGSCRAIKDSAKSRSRPEMEGSLASPSTFPDTGPATGVNPNHAGQPAPLPGDRASDRAAERTNDATSQRSRNAADAMADSFSATPVPTEYNDCKVTSSTTSFGLYSNGRVYMLDDPESAVRNKVHIKPATGWHHVSMTGSMQGGRIQVNSVK